VEPKTGRRPVVECPPFEPPQIADEDIAWVCDVLELQRQPSARGRQGRGLEILKSTETLDIEACPGSGKTTLLVAKLAILARKWTSARQGICVLSHTNVARREIESASATPQPGSTCLHILILSEPFMIRESVSCRALAPSLGFPIRMMIPSIVSSTGGTC